MARFHVLSSRPRILMRWPAQSPDARALSPSLAHPIHRLAAPQTPQARGASALRQAYVEDVEGILPQARGYGAGSVEEMYTRPSNPSVFPFTDEFRFRGLPGVATSAELLEVLEPLITEERLAKISQVCSQRTFNVLPIVEGSINTGNLHAVCRTSEALGCGAVHSINTAQKMKKSQRTSAGADKWLDVVKWDSTKDCLEHAKAAGYQVVVTHLREDAVTVDAVDWTKPTAIVLGNEAQGVSQEAVDAADHCAIIPMDGFVESFNISVAASLVLYEARSSRQRLLGRHGDLTEDQHRLLRAVMCLRHQSSVVKIDTHDYMSSLLSRLREQIAK